MMHVHLPTQVNAFELSENTDLAHQLTPAQQFFSAWPNSLDWRKLYKQKL